MKKPVLFLISVLLVNALTASPSVGAAKFGKKCSKVGTTSKIDGRVFTCIKLGKKLVWDKGRIIINPARQSSASSTQSNPLVPAQTQLIEFTETGNQSNLELCKLQDARIKRTQPNNVGFPLQEDIIPVSGNVNVIVIPVDFSDRPADGIPTNYLAEQSKKMNDWYEYFSASKMSLTFQIGKRWVRAPKPDSAYIVPKNQANANAIAFDIQRNMAQDIINSSGSEFDFNKSNVIFFYMPTISSIDYDMGGRGVNLKVNGQEKSFFFWGGGAYHFDNRNLKSETKKEKMWAFWIHEMLHSQGLALHAPANGSATGLHTDQYGSSLVLNSWELFRLGWVADSNVVCIDTTNPLNHRIVLNPLEVSSRNSRFVIVRINQFEALIIESRRPVGYSKEWKSNQAGLLVSRIDVRNDNDRSGESTGDTGNSESYPKWGYLISPSGRDLNGLSPFEVERYIFRVGDSATYSGITVKLINSSSSQDFVEIKSS